TNSLFGRINSLLGRINSLLGRINSLLGRINSLFSILGNLYQEPPANAEVFAALILFRSSKMQNSLFFPCQTGNLPREWFAADCLIHHPVRRFSPLSQNRSLSESLPAGGLWLS